jgi:hypothetical protein
VDRHHGRPDFSGLDGAIDDHISHDPAASTKAPLGNPDAGIDNLKAPSARWLLIGNRHQTASQMRLLDNGVGELFGETIQPETFSETKAAASDIRDNQNY